MQRSNTVYSEQLVAADAEALRTRSRADYVYESLRDAIWEGRIPQGERLREEEIGNALGVSRTPVREGLKRLQERGLVEFGAGRGLVVAGLTRQQVFEVYAVREILEGSSARFAAQHANAAEISLLYQLQEELAAAPDDALVQTKLNRKFHQAIYDAAHNRYLLQALDTLHDSMALLHNTTFRKPSNRTDSDEDHRKIVVAIEKRDPDEAERMAREHIQRAQRTRF